jgi:phage baseplate assembly protein W
MANAIYRGFSSAQWNSSRTFGLSNIELVKQDLLNHIYTLKGERLMMPSFGTRIPMLTFEPNDEETRQIVEDDLKAVFAYDPRVSLITLSVLNLPDNNAIIAFADLLYVEFNVRDVLNIEVKSK